MKLYELTCLISPDLSEEELRSFRGEVNEIVQQEGGVSTESKPPIKIKLAHQIKKKGVAFLSSMDFSLESERLDNLIKRLGTKSGILRYQIFTKKIPSRRKILSRRAAPELPEISPKPKSGEQKLSHKAMTRRKEEKVELKEIEKKLEEILGQ